MSSTLLQPGTIIKFGRYPQTSEQDYSPIDWRILQVRSNELFLLSKYILDCKRFHHTFADINWATADIRQWLNNDFYNTAFNTTEKEQILTTCCSNNGINSPDTQDKVFLLSAAELLLLTDASDGPSGRKAIGTPFARLKKPDGCSLYVYDKAVEKDYFIDQEERKGCSWWWTRTQQHESAARATFVGPRSSIRNYARVDLHRDGVRPALKIKVG